MCLCLWFGGGLNFRKTSHFPPTSFTIFFFLSLFTLVSLVSLSIQFRFHSRNPMADTSHLEKMGRELKCPICLSLFNSAISLTCNHVFCNSCIHKSMRSGSNCPVCKVPYQRREIRPAPHMDNLVNIYKSMEVASGLSLFVSQNGPSNKLADAEMQANVDLDGRRVTGEETPEIFNRKRMKGLSSTEAKLKRKCSGRNRGKSSFPTNKRVQVPQSPTETPVSQGNNELDQTINFLNKCSMVPNEHPISTKQESSHLSPFFWVREEEERSSQQTDVEPLTCTPLKSPSFSDLKDSDDEVPPEVSGEPHSKCNANFFDSEMFEWTQRVCSPEVCSNPLENQVDGIEGDITLGQNIKEASNSTMVINQPANDSPQKKNSLMDNELHDNGYPRRNIEDSLNAHTRKRGGKDRKESQKTYEKSKIETTEAHDGLKTTNDFMKCQGSDNEVVLGTSKVVGTSKTRHVQSLYPRLMNEVDNHVAELSVSSESRKSNHKDKKLGNFKRNLNSTEQSHECVSVKRKRQMKNPAKPCIIAEKSNFSKEMPHENPSRVVKKSKSCITSHKPKEISQLTSVFQQQISLNGTSKEKMTDEGENVQGKSNDNVKHSFEKGKFSQKKDMTFLPKCNTIAIKCAFCHSIEETEDFGEIVHYFKGKPVLSSHTGGSVIHSHKNCTEWAPNVYFEENIAVNLEEELIRSRRIKCSLCGVKGAALGCYEKSCRKSFHVPCAKKLKECRWDTDHFVILCPLHVSSKLPCELPAQEVIKAKCNLKGCQRSGIEVRHTSNVNRWNCGRSSEKVVICCSALATADKEAVSELAKSAGAVVLGSWNASVTHVIASTNENGACKRTLKVLKGILEGKWVLSIKWVQVSMEANRLVEETPYEITCDIHGVQNGPCLGRLRLQNQQTKLFSGFKFYFAGDFESSYKGYLQDLVTTAGGTVLHRKPIAETNGTKIPSSSTVIVYSVELPVNCDLLKKDMIVNHRRSDAQALAVLSGAKIASNSWLLNSIAGHKLQDLLDA